MRDKTRIAVLVSGGGTNLQALIDARERVIRDGEIVVVISNKAGAYALERAAKAGIPGRTVLKKDCGSQSVFEQAIKDVLTEYKVDLIVLAGFLSILSADFTNAYPKRIINVHPSLIPSFCGAGYYGLRVHEAALNYGVKVTGATVHFVDEDMDSGPILLQKAVAVQEGDTPEILQRRVMEEAEWELLPRAISLIAEGRVRVEGRKTFIK